MLSGFKRLAPFLIGVALNAVYGILWLSPLLNRLELSIAERISVQVPILGFFVAYSILLFRGFEDWSRRKKHAR
jgi:hypothetical protein